MTLCLTGDEKLPSSMQHMHVEMGTMESQLEPRHAHTHAHDYILCTVYCADTWIQYTDTQTLDTNASPATSLGFTISMAAKRTPVTVTTTTTKMTAAPFQRCSVYTALCMVRSTRWTRW